MSTPNETISPSQLEKIYQAGIITEETRRTSLTFIKGPKNWGLWIERLFLSLGTTLILASIMFFFAYNWENLGKWLKFGLVEAAILISLLAAIIPFKAKVINETLSIAASFLTGVLLALIGQTYQTGADAWQLFALWSVLIIPWVVLSKSAAHWALWLIVCNIALGFWMQQTLSLTRHQEILIPTAHAVLNGTALAIFLYARQFFTWLQNPWSLRLLTLGVIINLGLLSIQCIFHRDLFTSWPFAITLAILLAQGLIFYLSRFRWKDFITHALLIISLAIQAETMILKFLNTHFKWDTGILFFGSILTLATFTCLVVYLRKIHPKMEAANE